MSGLDQRDCLVRTEPSRHPLVYVEFTTISWTTPVRTFLISAVRLFPVWMKARQLTVRLSLLQSNRRLRSNRLGDHSTPPSPWTPIRPDIPSLTYRTRGIRFAVDPFIPCQKRSRDRARATLSQHIDTSPVGVLIRTNGSLVPLSSHGPDSSS
jgi:hypothetical protein